MIYIKGIPKEEILAALYNASSPRGLGVLHAIITPMSIELARDLLKEYTDFDYVMGRPLKVDLKGDEFDPRLYDRDNGQGAAAEALKKLLAAHGGTETK